MDHSRRAFLRAAAGVAAGFAGLQRFVSAGGASVAAGAVGFTQGWEGYGELIRDPEGVFDLPRGFSYRVISRWGERMDDGLLVPALHDGMAAFAGSGGKTILVRNHEVESFQSRYGAFGWGRELQERVARDRFYDFGHGRGLQGGTTTLVYDTKSRRLERHFLSLAGTARNCAGGPTPWNTWLTCEEWTVRADESRFERDHGYVFEVPAREEIGLADPIPIKGMGRFNHEAVAVDPASGVVYQTEDREDGLLYRYVPNVPGKLLEGGRLQALVIADSPSMDTRNWEGAAAVRPGDSLRVKWIDLEKVEAPEDDLRYRGYEAGVARFARAEGMWYGNGAVYFACTTGGAKKLGQIWRYRPSAFEGREGEADAPGTLELFIEPNDGTLIENADNLTVAPSGDLFVCEDGGAEDHLVTVTPEGELSRFGRNRLSDSELAGATFAPDGSTLFVNVQQAGLTLAIWGPWRWL